MADARNREPTPSRLRRAWEAGLRPGAEDLRLLLVLGAMWAALGWFAGDAARICLRLLRETLALAAAPVQPLAALSASMTALGSLLGPPLLCLGGAALAGLLLPPRLRNPFQARSQAGLGERQPWLEAGWAWARTLWLGLLLLGLVGQLAPGLRSLPIHRGLLPLQAALLGLVDGVLGRALLALALAAPLGLWIERHLYRVRLRMSETELRRERRADAIDPRVRQALRQRAQPPPVATPEQAWSVVTHVLWAPGEALLLRLSDAAEDVGPQLVLRIGDGAGRSAVARARGAAIPCVYGPALVAQLRVVAPGDSLPRPCYRALARAFF